MCFDLFSIAETLPTHRPNIANTSPNKFKWVDLNEYSKTYQYILPHDDIALTSIDDNYINLYGINSDNLN